MCDQGIEAQLLDLRTKNLAIALDVADARDVHDSNRQSFIPQRSSELGQPLETGAHSTASGPAAVAF